MSSREAAGRRHAPSPLRRLCAELNDVSPAARAPERTCIVQANGLQLHVCEWGARDAAPLLLAHGIGDFARSFDVFAPLLADAGWRVIAWDQRGHGDSQHADLYSWQADARDALVLADTMHLGRLPAIGHSKGGALLAWLAQALPARFSHLVLLEGLSFNPPTVDAETFWQEALRTGTVHRWLDRQHEPAPRYASGPEALAAARARLNPRLRIDWLHYLARLGTRQTPQGWRWKHDARAVQPIIGPHPSQWMLPHLPALAPRLLAIVGGVRESLSWNVAYKDIEPWLPPAAEVQVWDDTGHFVHIEQPARCAQLIIDFLRHP